MRSRTTRHGNRYFEILEILKFFFEVREGFCLIQIMGAYDY